MTTIGRYKVIRLLGKGGMSEVYEVENARLGSRHALKLFTYEKDDAEVRGRFLTEGKLLARLNHPRIVRVTDFGTDETSGKPYFVMDLILDERGQTRSLADVEPGMADEQEIGRWYDDLREGLAYIHANGVIHRDLKLQNVLIGPDGHAVLTDFGISKIFDAQGDGKTIVDTVNTIVKMKEGRSLVMGSIGYMAPELEMGVAASPQSDWYALGVIVYRLLTGSWCDARTDVIGTLETYDPVWTRILPKLLHANPQGRECLSYVDERRAERERVELEWEERWLRAKALAHIMRRVALAVTIALVLAVVGSALYFGLTKNTLEMVDAKTAQAMRLAAMPTFEDIVRLPERAEPVSAGDRWVAERANYSLVDAWAMTHQLFDDLRKGAITLAKAQESLAALASKSEVELVGMFGVGKGMVQRGDPKTLSLILKNASAELNRRYPPDGGK